MSTDEYVIVGKLGRPRGVDGEIYVTPDTDFPHRFLGLTEIYVSDRLRWEKWEIASSRMVSGRPVIRFDKITTPQEAARLTNRKLAVLKKDVVSLPLDTYYIFDLIGCDVREEGSERLFGVVADVECCPANDVYVIESVDGKRVRCPAVKQYVRQIDVKKREITIIAVGLIEDE